MTWRWVVALSATLACALKIGLSVALIENSFRRRSKRFNVSPAIEAHFEELGGRDVLPQIATFRQFASDADYPGVVGIPADLGTETGYVEHQALLTPLQDSYRSVRMSATVSSW